MKMPKELLEPKDCTLADLRPGERSIFPLYEVYVDLSGDIFVMKSTELPSSKDSKIEYGMIAKDVHGLLHLTVPSTTERRWKPQEMGLFIRYGGAEPLETFALNDTDESA